MHGTFAGLLSRPSFNPRLMQALQREGLVCEGDLSPEQLPAAAKALGAVDE